MIAPAAIAFWELSEFYMVCTYIHENDNGYVRTMANKKWFSLIPIQFHHTIPDQQFSDKTKLIQSVFNSSGLYCLLSAHTLFTCMINTMCCA